MATELDFQIFLTRRRLNTILLSCKPKAFQILRSKYKGEFTEYYEVALNRAVVQLTPKKYSDEQYIQMGKSVAKQREKLRIKKWAATQAGRGLVSDHLNHFKEILSGVQDENLDNFSKEINNSKPEHREAEREGLRMVMSKLRKMRGL